MSTIPLNFEYATAEVLHYNNQRLRAKRLRRAYLVSPQLSLGRETSKKAPTKVTLQGHAVLVGLQANKKNFEIYLTAFRKANS